MLSMLLHPTPLPLSSFRDFVIRKQFQSDRHTAVVHGIDKGSRKYESGITRGKQGLPGDHLGGTRPGDGMNDCRGR